MQDSGPSILCSLVNHHSVPRDPPKGGPGTQLPSSAWLASATYSPGFLHLLHPALSLAQTLRSRVFSQHPLPYSRHRPWQLLSGPRGLACHTPPERGPQEQVCPGVPRGRGCAPQSPPGTGRGHPGKPEKPQPGPLTGGTLGAASPCPHSPDTRHF